MIFTIQKSLFLLSQRLTEGSKEGFVVTLVERIQEDLKIWHFSNDRKNIRGVHDLFDK